MSSFIEDVAVAHWAEYGRGVEKMAFVFPNHRAGLFFQRELAKAAKEPLFSPTILTINKLFQHQSSLQVADKVSMLFALYRIYIEQSGSTESFDEFVFWGDMLLNDFDDVDKWLADPVQLFRNIEDLKEIDDLFDYLSSEQLLALKQFWSSFRIDSDGQKVKEFLVIWKVILPIYDTLRERLSERGLAYEGMLMREVAERANRKELDEFPYDKIVFVGFNAISTTEKALMSYTRDLGIGDFYWDFESDYLQERENKGSMFFHYVREFPSKLSLPKVGSSQPTYELIEVPSRIGQAKQLSEILGEMFPHGTRKNDTNAIRTAVILPDEQLLLPVLYSIPENIESINVTMGYSLSTSPIAGLFEQIIALQSNWAMQSGVPHFYFRFVRPVLLHRYIQAVEPKAAELEEHIRRSNLVYLPESLFESSSFLSLLFRAIKSGDNISSYLLKLLDAFVEINSEGEEESNISLIEREFIYHYYIALVRFGDLLQEESIEMSMDTYFKLLRKLIGGVSVSFQGEPLSGLQVMGVLETRVLDFDRLIILSMNEGVFPVRQAASTFIPVTLRRAFGLPTTEHQDGIYAYHFYRMIHRAKHITMLYDSRSDGLQTGEVSRFVHQLHYLYNHDIQKKSIEYNISITANDPIVIGKSEAVMSKLGGFLRGGRRAISASAINTFIDCPLKFYFLYVESVREQEEISETIEANTFGDIFHYVMEMIYNDLKSRGGLITSNVLLEVVKNKDMITRLLERAFAVKVYKQPEDAVRPFSLKGQNYLVGEIIRKYVDKMLKTDAKHAPFEYIASEMNVKGEIALDDDGSRVVQLKGFIDRVDSKDGVVRLLDYKSGSEKDLLFGEIEDLFDSESKDRPSYVLQVFFYSWLYQQSMRSDRIEPGVSFIRALFKDYDTRVYNRLEREKVAVSDFSYFSNDFESYLRDTLRDMFDVEQQFTQTTDLKRCAYCPFSIVCRR